MDKPVQKMLANEDLLCVLTSGGVITVFRRTFGDEDGKPITVLNVVRLKCQKSNSTRAITYVYILNR